MLALETIELTKDYRLGFWRNRTKRALDRLNLRVEAGEVFGLLGPNGAGKTTTLKLLFRLVFPTSGSARILGKPLDDLSLRFRVAYLPENPGFYEHLTAQEFLNYVASLFGFSAAERRRRLGELIDQLGLAASRDLPLRKFSKGMIQRLGIAQALINDPEVVFLDEPMSGLDPLGRREVREVILRLKERQKTVFFSTHILADAETLCDRVAVLHHGRLQGCGELNTILCLGVSTTELVLEGPSAEVMAALRPYASSVIRTGERVRLEIPEEANIQKTLEIILRGRTKLISVNPVKRSLEDYFLQKVGAEAVRESRSRGVEELKGTEVE
jgi:ABC-2 type transport system ATP-binding protein